MTVNTPLKIKDLSHNFGGKNVLDGINFDVKTGRMTVLLGNNGAGKTTLFSLITRLYRNKEGTIQVFGDNISKRSSKCLSRMGIVFQQRTVDLELSVYQNLYYHGLLHGVGKKKLRLKINQEAERLGIANLLGTKVRKLSGGQTRKVEIARAMLHDPALVLMDECTSGLDVESRDSLISQTREMCKNGLAVLWSTHLLDEIDAEDQVIVLNKGKIISNKTAGETIRESGTGNIRDSFSGMVRPNE